jgi:hypothetical protein
MIEDVTAPSLPQPSDKPKWRSVAYYNCRICNEVGADYIINVPEEDLPIPVCSSCYLHALNTKRWNKKLRNTDQTV